MPGLSKAKAASRATAAAEVLVISLLAAGCSFCRFGAGQRSKVRPRHSVCADDASAILSICAIRRPPLLSLRPHIKTVRARANSPQSMRLASLLARFCGTTCGAWRRLRTCERPNRFGQPPPPSSNAIHFEFCDAFGPKYSPLAHRPPTVPVFYALLTQWHRSRDHPVLPSCLTSDYIQQTQYTKINTHHIMCFEQKTLPVE